VKGRVAIARGLRRGLIITALIAGGVAVLAGSSAASHDGPHLSISGGTATEGGSITFTVTVADRDPLDTSTITVEYDTADGTAKEPGDYTSKSGTLSFLPADTSETIEVQTGQDSLDEPQEAFGVTLSGPSSGAEITTASASGTINDDDTPPTVSIGDAPAVAEGGTASFPVTLSAPSGQSVTVNYATGHVSTSASDFTPTAPLNGSVSFDAGQTSKSIALPTVNDALDEPNETFTVTLSSPTNASIATAQGSGTINDNDAAQLSINSAPAVTEGGNANFTVTLAPASTQTVTVNYSTANGSAIAPGDYDAVTSGNLSFAPGETTKPVAISTNEDALNEANENFTVTLSSPANATIASGQGTGTGTINDNDAAPALSINDATVTEGNSGTVFAVFTVTLSAASGQQVTVNYATANATATAPADYAAASATLTFAPGEATKTFSVLVNGDGADEPNETFHVNLSGAVNATISDGQGVGTINDDDGPGISINDVSVGEGSGSAVFTVSLGAPSAQQVTVNYATANGTAGAPGDYTTIPATTLTFAPGDTTETVSVPIANDAADEPNETFLVNLSGAVNASISDAQGIGTIVDDDGPTISINSPTPPAAGPGTESGNVTFTVSLSATSPQPITVQYATAPETAAAGSDYATQSGTLTIPAGQPSATIAVAIVPDNVDESNETFFVNLSNPTNATIADSQGQGTIVDDDSQPTLSISSAVSVTEGGNANFTVTLSATSGQPVTVSFSTANGTAVAPGDYAAAPSGTLTFAPGETSKPISISTSEDPLDEANETFTVTLANPTNATIATGQGTGTATINDNDNPPTVAIANAPAVVEGNPSVFTVSLSAASGQTVTVNFATANGSAVAGSDYTGSTGVLTYAPGEVSKQVSVVTLNDALDEPASETFTVTLSNPVNATIAAGQGTATGTINDNDEPPAISISDATVAADVPPGRVGEGNSGQGSCAGAPFHQCAVFTVSLSAASGQTVTVNFATADGTATSADYAAVGGTLTFSPGETTKQITVPIKGDVSVEFNETFTVNLSGPVNATIADGTGVGTIVNDDGSPALSVTGASDGEGSADGAIIVVALSSPSALEVRVNFSTSNGSAVAGADYTAQSQTLIFSPGQPLSKAIAIQLVNDALDEENETFTVNLTNPQNATIRNDPNTGKFEGTGTVTIQDDDAPPSVAIGDTVVSEGNAGTAAASFAVTLSAASGKEIRVNYATGNGSATQPDDYAAASGIVTFGPGETSKSVIVAVNGDGAVEPDETFFVDLSEPANVVIGDPQALGTITNDDVQQTDPGVTTTTTSTGPITTTTGPTTTSTNTTGPRPDPRLTGMNISRRPVTLLDNLAPIGVTCSKRATGRCTGTITVQATARSLSIVDGRPTAKQIRLGRAQFVIRRGATEKVLVPLNRRAVKAVNRAGRLQVTVVVTARDSAGKRSKPVTRQLVLKSAKKPKPKPKPKPTSR
jgi:hypothetical protein